MFIKTIELQGIVTAVRTRYEVAGIPSMPYQEYTVDVNGETHFADAMPNRSRIEVGDSIIITCDIYGYVRQRNRVHPSDVKNWTGELVRYTETWSDLVLQNCRAE